ncbi:MAG: glycosyltransferase family 4 protein [Candidatus Dormibacteria bacterium]
MTPGAAWLSALPPFLVAAGVCIVAVPLSMVLARRVGAVAHPDDERHLHAAPTPRLGGLAMLLGYVVALAVFGGQIQSRWPLLAVAGVVTLVMAVDDVVDVVWWQKLIVVLGAGVAFCALGISITSVDLPGIGMVNLGLLALPLTVLWVAGMQVSVNFMDGADGVAAGVVAIVALVAMLAAINRIIVPGDLQSGVVILSASLMGVCAGFLIFNLPPARTFMGDTGSHFLGVVLAAITIVGIAKVAVGLSILVPLIALGLPISDTAWAIVRRGRAGVSPTTPDAGHLHHRLQARGMTPMETALTFYFTTGVLGCLGLAIFGHRKILDIATALCALGVVTLFWRNRRRIQRLRHQQVALPGDPDAGMALTGHGAVGGRTGSSGELD